MVTCHNSIPAGIALCIGFIVGSAHATTPAAGPSFDCATVRASSMADLVCRDEALARLDRTLAEVYAKASVLAKTQRPRRLAAEQRGWIKGRDDCWKSDPPRACVEDSYRRRIAELQARYRLVEGTGPVRYICDGSTANEVVAWFFETDPPTAMAEYGDATSLMFRQPAASGARYEGRNESLWEHPGEATIRWGFGAHDMRCARRPG